ncbi:VOC family protein [Paenibacillus albus]|uniref:VOC domain-containing protein n=1 Tax=Paenibacillus albus TaxID=2495582 RepID=A0A3S9A2D9_9BACL|nr:VOC family protein [Paenibacillus albus]AZN39930.1 hypothetical protein EJC50_09915 [Paenibacillus albus]
MNNSARRFNEENYKPQYVTKAFKAIENHAVTASNDKEERQFLVTNGLDSEIDLMTLVQLPVRRLKETVTFYVEVLGMALSYPDRPIEGNTFVQTMPRSGPSLHLLETSNSEFRHLHGTINGKREEYLAMYVRSLSELYERLLREDAEIVNEPANGYLSFLDPEGHLIGIYERRDSKNKNQIESNMTGFRHIQMVVADPSAAAGFFIGALGFDRMIAGDDAIYISVSGGEQNQPMIRLVRAAQQDRTQPMHWMLDGQPKHALELHSKNIGLLKELVLENGGEVKEGLEFTSCGGYLKFYTPDGHYLWVNQDRKYSDY